MAGGRDLHAVTDPAGSAAQARVTWVITTVHRCCWRRLTGIAPAAHPRREKSVVARTTGLARTQTRPAHCDTRADTPNIVLYTTAAQLLRPTEQ